MNDAESVSESILIRVLLQAKSFIMFGNLSKIEMQQEDESVVSTTENFKKFVYRFFLI